MSSFYSFDVSVSSNGNSYLFVYLFFKKLKHKRKLKKLQTDLATAKQEAAITVLELNEKIKALCEGKPAPRGQYHHVTVTGPRSWVVYIVLLATRQEARPQCQAHTGPAAC